LTEVTRSWGIELELDDEDALPGWPVGLPPAVLLELPARFCTVPFTSTFLPTRLEKLDALPLSRYVDPLIAPLVPVGFVADGLFAPVGEVELEPPDADASVRMYPPADELDD
jgi:hypothetical protein